MKRPLSVNAPEFIPLSSKKKKNDEISPFELKEDIAPSLSTIPKVVAPALPPWCKNGEVPSNLHDEIQLFEEYLKPTPEELTMRKDVLKKITDTVSNLWPSATVQPFGSYVSGLFLPNSDIDIVILNAPIKSPLKALAKALVKDGVSTNLQLIENARVPIIKLIEERSHCNVDISFNISGGIENTKRIVEYLENYKRIRPLVLVLKYFLQLRGLNETYSGGIGSYALVIQVLSFLQFHSLNFCKDYEEKDLGILLMDFFDFYGTKFNFYSTGISVKNRGSYFSKSKKGWLQTNKPYLFSVEDPADVTNDVGKGSFAILQIKAAFTHAFHTLYAKEYPYASTMLSRILPVDPSLEEYRKFIKEEYKNEC